DTSYAGNFDAFVMRLSASGASLFYSTYLGGSGSDWGLGLAVDSLPTAVVVGQTGSADFPTTPGTQDSTYNGNDDAFLIRLVKDGSALAYSTFLGGSSGDGANGVAINGSTSYVTGRTGSADFPTTAGAYQTALSGSSDSFVTKVLPAGPPSSYEVPA